MTPSTRDTTDESADDRILSDFSTEPETAGYAHSTWAATILIIGLLFGGLPMLLPWYVGLPLAAVFAALLGIAFSAAPPHLSPLSFIRYRFGYWTGQQVFVPSKRTRTLQRESTTEQADADSETDT